MTQLTKQYFDEQFEKMAVMIAKGFESTATKEDIKSVRADIARLDKEIKALRAEIKALSAKLTNYMELSDKRYLELKHKDMVIAKWVKQIADKTGVEIDLAELEKF